MKKIGEFSLNNWSVSKIKRWLLAQKENSSHSKNLNSDEIEIYKRIKGNVVNKMTNKFFLKDSNNNVLEDR